MKTMLLALSLLTLSAKADVAVWRLSFTFKLSGGQTLELQTHTGFVVDGLDPSNSVIDLIDVRGSTFSVQSNLTCLINVVQTSPTRNVMAVTDTPPGCTGGVTLKGYAPATAVGNGDQWFLPPTMLIEGAAQYTSVGNNQYLVEWSGTATLDLIDTRAFNANGYSLSDALTALTNRLFDRGLSQGDLQFSY